jgi:PIN domain nuclease of toxin-antitoxin system
MRLLFDTHALIWFAEDHPHLSAPARTAIADGEDEVYCSIASIWEMAIMLSLGKLKMSMPLEGPFERLLARNGFRLIPVEYAHAARVAALPWHHRDPFDRLLVAQAMVEGMALLSHDGQLDAYGIKRIW